MERIYRVGMSISKERCACFVGFFVARGILSSWFSHRLAVLMHVGTEVQLLEYLPQSTETRKRGGYGEAQV